MEGVLMKIEIPKCENSIEALVFLMGYFYGKAYYRKEKQKERKK